jgi:GNAT superfamily N-acetyltransferase
VTTTPEDAVAGPARPDDAHAGPARPDDADTARSDEAGAIPTRPDDADTSRSDDARAIPADGGAAVVIRPAVPADATAMVTLRALMFEAMGTGADALADPAWRLAAHGWFVDRVGSSGVRVVVAEVAGEVVSAAVGEVTALIPGPSCPNGTVGLVSNVATLPEHRGRGLAAACTDDLLAWFEKATDVTRVDLFATADGERIYAPRGFTVSTFPAMRRQIPRD